MEADAGVMLVVSNLFIGTCYFAAAGYVVPQFVGMTWPTRVSAVLFLSLCGLLNHYELAAHFLRFGEVPGEELLSFHMVWGHNLQAFSAAGFVGGVARDVARGRNPFLMSERRRRDEPVRVDRRRR